MSSPPAHSLPHGTEPGPIAEPPGERRHRVEAERAGRCHLLRAELEATAPRCAAHARRTLEIGCGHGHFLEALAAAHPEEFCLGIDYCADRTRRALRKQGRNRHGNLHFMRAEVGEFLDALPATYVFDTIYVLFPDPWPKRRHQKNRLISERFLDRIARSVRPGAALCLRTDSEAYFAEARQTIAAHAAWRIDGEADWPFEQPTVFQVKAPSYQSLVAFTGNPAR